MHPGIPPHSSALPSVVTNYPIGTILTYTCDLGYNLTGSSVLICTGDGTWDLNPPICLDESQTALPPDTTPISEQTGRSSTESITPDVLIGVVVAGVGVIA